MVSKYSSTRLSASVVATILKTQAEHSKLLNEILIKLESISSWNTINGQRQRQNDSFSEEPANDSVEAETNKSNSTEQNVDEFEAPTPIIDSPAPALVKCTDPLCTCLTCCPPMLNEFEVKPEPEVDQNIVENQNQNSDSLSASDLNNISSTPQKITKPCSIKLVKFNLPPRTRTREPQRSLPSEPEPDPLPPPSQINSPRDMERPFICQVQGCGKKYASENKFKIHQLIHTGQKPGHLCPHCTAGFHRRDAFRVHLLKHTGERPFGCTSCDKRFITNYQLSFHWESAHISYKPLECNLCDKCFATKRVLHCHQKIHRKDTGEGFVCQVQGCGKTFSSKQFLKTHSYKHTTEKRYKCDLCFGTYAHAFSLKRHKKVMHKDHV